MSHRGPLPPIYTSDRRYDLFKTELQLWDSATEVADEKRGVTIALALPDDDKLHLRSTVLDKIDRTKLKEKGGLNVLIALLDELLGEDDLEDSLHKYEEFEDYKRSSGESIAQYIVAFEAKYDKVKNKGIKLPPEVLAFKLLRRAGISREDKKLVLTGMDYNDRDALFKHAQKALKKYCGDGSASGGGTSSSFGNRSGEAMYKLDKTDDVLLSSSRGGFYGPGRGYVRRGRYSQWPHQRGNSNFRRGAASTSNNWRSNWTPRGNTRGSHFGQGTGKPFPSAVTYGSRGGSQGERPLNPVGLDGQRLLCDGCGSYRHFLRQCPESWDKLRQNNTSKVNCVTDNENETYYEDEEAANSYGQYENYENYEYYENPEYEADSAESHIVLFTGYDKVNLVKLSTEAQNSAVLDTACTSTVCGEDWLGAYIEALGDLAQPIKKHDSQRIFKFGAGPRMSSTGQYELPANVAGHDVTILTDVVQSDIPLLLSKSAMKTAKVKINIADDTADILGKHVNLNLTSSGHYCIPILPEHSTSIKSVLTVKLDDVTQHEQTSVFVKLHRQFGHPPEAKLRALLKDAGVWRDEYAETIKQVYAKCQQSGMCRFKRVTRPAVAMSLSNDFNEKVAMDLKYWEGRWILHMIDLWSRFTMSTFIDRKKPTSVIHALLTEWCSIFGFMQGVLTDNGGEFASAEMLEVESILNVEVLTTAAESPFQNGVCERNHQVVDAILYKLVHDYPKTPISILLKWACMAKNTLQMWSGFSSHQLVFGRNPNLPNILNSSPSSLSEHTRSEIFAQHLNSMAAARKEFIASESCDKIKKALKSKIRTSEVVFNHGDKVYYKRDNREDWLGPAKVIFQDGKVIYIRHGFDWLKVSPNKLVKSGQEFDTSNDKINMQIINQKLSTKSNADRMQEDYNSDDSTDQNVVSEHHEEIDIDCENSSEQFHENVETGGNESSDQSDLVDGNPASPAATRRSLRQFNAKTGSTVYTCKDDKHEHSDLQSVFITLIPKHLQNNEKCINAKNEELEKLQSFNAYEVVPDNGQQRISTRWVMTTKDNKVKARLVARGFEELSGVQSDSPTISKCGMRICLMIAAMHGWQIETTDIKSAFLQGDEMQRCVYVDPPKEAGDEHSIWRLKKCLYGLSDASRVFYFSLNEELVGKLGCEKSAIDPSLFFKRDQNGNLIGMLVSHIDDFLHCGTAIFKEQVLDELRKRFIAGKQETKDFTYVGYQINQSADGIQLNQTDYIQSIDMYKVPDGRSARRNDSLSNKEKTILRSMVGSLNWAVQGSRPDAAFEMIDLSTKFNNGVVGDLDRACKILNKIKENSVNVLFPNLGKPENWKLVVFSDASFANLCDGVSSAMAYIVFMVGEELRCCPLVWRACKINRVVRSTLAAETMALQEAVDDAFCVRQMVKQIMPNYDFPMKCKVDNKSLVDKLYSTCSSTEEKSLRINIASLKQAISNVDIDSVSWIETSDQLADPMTKRGAKCANLLAVLQAGRLPDIYDI